MPAGYPVKVNYLTGDVLTAADLNDLAGTVNLYDPTAKGDLFPASAADTVARLAVGANNTVLTADSTAATGMKWAAGGGDTYMLVQDQKPQDTHGGSSIQGVNTRTLNTVVSNTISGASLATNKITLPAGTYRITGSAPYYNGSEGRAYLYNVTDSVIAISGTSEFITTTLGISVQCWIFGRITIAGSKDFELRQVIRGASVATFGLGRAVNSASAPTELYSSVTIVREA